MEELKCFIEHLNFWGGDLKFTIELEEDNKLPVLDILLLKNENSLDFKIYSEQVNFFDSELFFTVNKLVA